jgi:hypothetical protein
MGMKWPVKFSLTTQLPRHCRVLLYAAKLRHGTEGFTSPPKKGMLRILLPEKSDGFSRVSNPRTWVPEASMVTTRPKPLDYSTTCSGS